MSFLWIGVFSGSFGVRGIVLCKCSGKYIDIYFKLKITYFICHLFCYLFVVFRVFIPVVLIPSFYFC